MPRGRSVLRGSWMRRRHPAWRTRTAVASISRLEAGGLLPTLAFGNYLRPQFNEPHHLCFDNQLVRPAGPAGYGRPIPLAPGWCALSMLFSDWDRSGRRDLRISNDREYYLPEDGE